VMLVDIVGDAVVRAEVTSAGRQSGGDANRVVSQS
jgi:hypothetical protein